jgi:hypothetical protein
MYRRMGSMAPNPRVPFDTICFANHSGYTEFGRSAMKFFRTLYVYNPPNPECPPQADVSKDEVKGTQPACALRYNLLRKSLRVHGIWVILPAQSFQSPTLINHPNLFSLQLASQPVLPIADSPKEDSLIPSPITPSGRIPSRGGTRCRVQPGFDRSCQR